MRLPPPPAARADPDRRAHSHHIGARCTENPSDVGLQVQGVEEMQKLVADAEAAPLSIGVQIDQDRTPNPFRSGHQRGFDIGEAFFPDFMDIERQRDFLDRDRSHWRRPIAHGSLQPDA